MVAACVADVVLAHVEDAFVKHVEAMVVACVAELD